MASLIRDCLFLILLNYMMISVNSLHSCSLVNKTWCQVSVPFLWIYFQVFTNILAITNENHVKFYNVITHFLPNNLEEYFITFK
ncbi:hypothetical protein GLOIN_2v1092318 [Rhizophagus irregularis DAOM 181602=DAOM 197198]|uniref:F-box domain-containing protein n=1 Tax=Rhizophagus irregularis (strain DAOM 181602 / DAOM 197198 / MUCL 43194) TaxID=747089 RepID=A0A2P4Q7K2_RHIID|nr:hypothetical protein GLOIN_2v1092318 [Rhizophagus irregularis DAOM 181602=DAOM 197198]POG73614.1 hypothetical protein GLOIN_2v1092318 [Rhizophagus irregularis DAOM 181602=DAOM 197198]GET50099.1 hypothetical protein GLOIN_2v1092318 [Rhizophagus irregularis DAOM 181602=DAOM 197198]|eukprot:XP_025180480.1 hypothetical protein GLOIN_2v1092318 [Rhizophagus irregularis DAOM 181602=DAOM 197198]